MLALAEAEAGKMKDEYVSVEHLFLAVLQKAKNGIAEVFKSFAIDFHPLPFDQRQPFVTLEQSLILLAC